MFCSVPREDMIFLFGHRCMHREAGELRRRLDECGWPLNKQYVSSFKLEVAQSRRPPLPEIVLWIAASRSPSESQTSECSDLLSRSRATFMIVAQRQPGKLIELVIRNLFVLHNVCRNGVFFFQQRPKPTPPATPSSLF